MTLFRTFQSMYHILTTCLRVTFTLREYDSCVPKAPFRMYQISFDFAIIIIKSTIMTLICIKLDSYTNLVMFIFIHKNDAQRSG